ncbi:hypothetical protein HYPSUDRAFT_206552 [Hypholoma sublateritium FD-334 SS-4]|uniref:Uncharacterized protein n=1 Tax=Hypholoma sublateritium (strain FD-334 SS-4) TaxID=945553 RepID=A0A0D2ND08_HYPSF|nr:hypothetical protein HYPSUDRAFT_206552 [Hypholoma sublateritium FD-334 SS-4]
MVVLRYIAPESLRRWTTSIIDVSPRFPLHPVPPNPPTQGQALSSTCALNPALPRSVDIGRRPSRRHEGPQRPCTTHAISIIITPVCRSILCAAGLVSYSPVHSAPLLIAVHCGPPCPPRRPRCHPPAPRSILLNIAPAPAVAAPRPYEFNQRRVIVRVQPFRQPPSLGDSLPCIPANPPPPAPRNLLPIFSCAPRPSIDTARPGCVVRRLSRCRAFCPSTPNVPSFVYLHVTHPFLLYCEPFSVPGLLLDIWTFSSVGRAVVRALIIAFDPPTLWFFTRVLQAGSPRPINGNNF